ncbi:probable E3 ubiquitin-protein ligase makorin-1 [Liolophura sinensis]|uniref:probable E3 ubiquitin-protein ligase makorin-1 n=1 Tax=Liolophura sinensis TaxID=3198878 RepID=UPI003158C5FF
MAEGLAAATELGPWTSKVLCRYFMHGVCREGSNCRFSHDLNGPPPSNVCKFYLEGSCTYGDRCRYDHVKPKANSTNGTTTFRLSSQGSPDKRLKPAPISKPPAAPIGKMVTLKKHGSAGESLPSSPLSPSISLPHKDPDLWVRAAEFVPGKPYQPPVRSTYAAATKTRTDDSGETSSAGTSHDAANAGDLLCPFAAKGECRFGEQCAYTHGDLCELCGMAILHPTDQEQRDNHMKDCMQVLEKDMELSFAIAQSKDKSCGICMDKVLEKQPPCEQRFGIMSNCNHVFCLACIRKWRSNKAFENKIIRSCPECRTVSDFVTPSKYWVESREEKDKLIEGYKKALSGKPCRYFDQGRGECPFNEKCFYLHAYPDGRKADAQPRQRRHRANADGDLDLLQQILLWDFFEENQNQVVLELQLADELDHLLTLAAADLLGDSSDSDFDDVIW